LNVYALGLLQQSFTESWCKETESFTKNYQKIGKYSTVCSSVKPTDS